MKSFQGIHSFEPEVSLSIICKGDRLGKICKVVIFPIKLIYYSTLHCLRVGEYLPHARQKYVVMGEKQLIFAPL